MRLSRPIPVLKRRARLHSRELGIPLHAALDQLAKEEGFRTWSHLAAHASVTGPARDLFEQLHVSDLILLGSRPGQGKTALGLELIAEALKAGDAAVFFTFEFTESDVRRRLATLMPDASAAADRLRIDTSDEISADHIRLTCADCRPGTLLVIDYLQLLDQRRSNPVLADQIATLSSFTRERKLRTVCLSQIGRTFVGSGRDLPTLSDVRLPNPVNLDLFTKACFLHEGRMRVDHLK